MGIILNSSEVHPHFTDFYCAAAPATTAPCHHLPETKETSEPLSVIPPGPNLNCCVELSPLSIDVLTPMVRKRSNDSIFPSLLQTWEKKEPENPFIDVYICFYCGEEFSTRLSLQGHQWCCDMKPPELQAVTPPGKVGLSRHDNPASPLPPLLCLPVDGAWGMHTPAKESNTYPYVRPAKDRYISALGLLPKKKAAQVSKRRRNTECESIDLDDDIPISPTMPRTPKLLISHLSRDGSESNGANSSPFRRRRSLFCSQSSRNEKEESEKSTENEIPEAEEKEDEGNPKIPQRNAKSLYNLDLTSPLGQFVIKHVKGDPNLHVLSDVESHCLTTSPKKSAAASRLRERVVNYPVTFRGYTGKFFAQHLHQYKFNRQQKKEFLLRVNTGLDKKSRVLKKKMKPCKVKLTRLTSSEIKKWKPSQNEVTVSLKPLTAQEIAYWTCPKQTSSTDGVNKSTEFPSGLTFSSPDVNSVLGLRTRQDIAFFNRCHLSVSNYVSEETFAEVTANRRAVYKSLLSDSASTDSGSSEIENSPALVERPKAPLLRQLLSAPSRHNTTLKESRTLPDITNFNVDMSRHQASDYGVLSPVSSSSSGGKVYKSSVGSERKRSSGLPSVKRSISSSSSNTSLGSSTCKSSSILNLSGAGTPKVPMATRSRRLVGARLGPVHSGIYTVQMQIALGGERIQAFKGYSGEEERGNVDGSNEHSKCDNSIIPGDLGTEVGRRMKNGSKKSVDCLAKKRLIEDSDKYGYSKRLKIERKESEKQSSPKENGVITRSVRNQDGSLLSQDISKGNIHTTESSSPHSGRKNGISAAGITRAVKAIKKAVRKLSQDFESSKKQQKTCAVSKPNSNLDSDSAGGSNVSTNSGDSQKTLTSIREPNKFHMSTVTEPVTQNGKRLFSTDHGVAATDTSQPLKLRIPLIHGWGDSVLKPGNDGMVPNSLGTSSSTENLRTISDSPHGKRTRGNTMENGDIENLNVNTAVMDSPNKKSARIFHNTVLQTSACTSPNSKLSPGKIEAVSPTGLKLVSYSSPQPSPNSPHLRKTCSRTYITPSHKTEARKSLLTSFLMEANSKKPSPFLEKVDSPPRSGMGARSKTVVPVTKDKLRHNPLKGKERR